MTTTQTQSKPVPLASAAENDASAPLPPALPDLQSLPDDVLALLATEAPKEVERRKNKRESEFLETVRAQAQLLGVSPERLKAALFAKAGARRTTPANGDGRSSVKPKYRDPNSGKTWSGRGNAPKWYSAHIAAGGTEADCLIPEGAV